MLNQYHALMNLPQSDWEMVREHASQSLGNPPSPMWFPMQRVGGDRQSLENIARLRTPQLAARYMEADAADPAGGSFSETLDSMANAAGVGAVIYAGHKIGQGIGSLAGGVQNVVAQGAQLARQGIEGAQALGQQVASGAQQVAQGAQQAAQTTVQAAQDVGRATVASGQAVGQALKEAADQGVVQGSKTVGRAALRAVEDVMPDASPAQLAEAAAEKMKQVAGNAADDVGQAFNSAVQEAGLGNLADDLAQVGGEDLFQLALQNTDELAEGFV